jgi:hypothetical protein
MAMTASRDLILKRFRTALDEIYGDRLERVVLFCSVRVRGAMRVRIPITTLPFF